MITDSEEKWNWPFESRNAGFCSSVMVRTMCNSLSLFRKTVRVDFRVPGGLGRALVCFIRNILDILEVDERLTSPVSSLPERSRLLAQEIQDGLDRPPKLQSSSRSIVRWHCLLAEPVALGVYACIR